jgi:hypothetical protein
MLIIWGFRVRSSSVGGGEFFCPSCGGDRHYDLKKARRWFTVFFLPLIPLKELGQFIECSTCKKTYNDGVLSLPTTATMQSSLLAAGRTAMVWLLRVGDGSPSAEGVAIEALSGMGGQAYTADQLRHDVDTLEVSDLPAHLAPLSSSLNEQGKESFLAACTRVAAAGGGVTDASRPVLESIAGALSMTSAHARGVIAETVERQS